jgi:tetratricopeptide (TPR) repeat protein
VFVSGRDQVRQPLPAEVPLAERDFYRELRRLIDIAGLSVRALQELTSSVKSPSSESCLYSKSQWARWINGRSRPPRKAVSRLAAKLAAEGIDAGHLADLWDKAFTSAPPDWPAGSTLISPRQLPAGTAYFAGREAELDALTGLADDAADATGTVVISAISGTAGVGKTALAVHWARLAAHRFPDGQLFVHLRGYDPSGTPVAPAEAIRDILGTLSRVADRMPVDLDAQAALYRSVLAGRRMLIILDNARTADQVRPLLPGSPGCMVIVTSRHQLTSLIAAEGARPLTLDLLSEAEARELLAHRIGAQRIAAEPAAAAELLALCARLPLALCIVTARAATRPSFPLTVLTSRLRDTRDRLDALDAGDRVGSVRAVISCSYADLRTQAARMFRLLGLHAGPDISVPAAASLAGIPAVQARQVLDELTAAHLLAEHVPGRFGCHDLLRAFAEEQADTSESQAGRRDAMHRMLDHYLHTAHAADLLLSPGRDPLPLPPLQTAATPEHLTDGDAALAWFEAEQKVLLRAITQACDGGCGVHAWQLTWAIGRFLDRRGYWQEWYTALRTALAAAEGLGDQAAQAHLHDHLGIAETRLGLYQDAHTSLERALVTYRQLGDRKGEARTHQYAGMVFEWQGRYGEALGHARQALDLYRATGQRAGEADALNAVGWFYAHLRDYEQAAAGCQHALDLYRELGDRHGEAAAWDSIGYAQHHLGQHAQAAVAYQHALNRYRELGNRFYQADTLTHLGDTHRAANDLNGASQAWKQALDILEDLRHPDAGELRAKLSRLNEATEPTRR